MPKKMLLDRKMICEWLNPVLGAGFTGGFGEAPYPGSGMSQDGNNPFIQAPDRNAQRDNGICQDLLDDPPAWLVCNGEDDVIIQGDKEYLGAMYINGVPLSSWGAVFGGNTQYARKNVMNNWSDVATHMQTLFQDTISKHTTTDNEESEFKIDDVTIQKIAPVESGLGINIYVKFKFNNEEIFGKFQRWGIQGRAGCTFICEPLRNLIHPEMWLRSTGKLKSMIEKWMKPAAGVYKCLAREVIIYNEFGSIDRIERDQAIEVTRSENDRITLNIQGQKWYIKTPTYYWFNYYFALVKK